MKKIMKSLCRKITTIFSLGTKKYDYFLETQYILDECFEFRRSQAEIEALAKKSFISAKIKFLVTVFLTVAPIITYSVWLIFFRDIPSDNTFSMIKALKNLDEVWIDFIGSVLGSAITVLGVYISVRYDSRQQQTLKLQKSQPIIIPEIKKRKYEENVLTANIDFQTDKYDESKENIEIQISYLAIRNIGFNVAVDVSISLSIKGYEFKCVFPFGLLKKDEITEISGSIKMAKDTFLDIVSKEIYFFNYPTTNRSKSFKHIAGKVHGRLNLFYSDVYENESIKVIPITVHFVKKEDDSYEAKFEIDNPKETFYKFIRKMYKG